jgi:Ca-activated chloride channel homolog
MSSMPRHARTTRSRRRGRTAAGVVVSAALVASGAAALTRPSSQAATCPHRAPLNVAVSPDLEPFVAAMAAEVGGRAEAGCPQIEVRAEDSASFARLVRHRGKVPADVWIPDSSLWSSRTDLTRSSMGSVVTSPVVLAVAAQTAAGLTSTDAPAGLSGVVPRDARPPLVLDLADPIRSARTSGVLLGLRRVLAGREDARRSMAGLLADAVPRADADAAHLPAHLAPGRAVAASEQQVFAANDRRATPGLAALYASGPGSVLDYPFVVLSSSPAREAAAGRLLDALHAPAGRAASIAEGFRDGDGLAGGPLTSAPGVDASRPAAAPPAQPAEVAAVASLVSVIREQAHLLAVIDVSGSMGTVVPGTGGATRLQLVQRAAARGLSLYGEADAAGLWIFSTRLHGSADYRSILPVTVLGGSHDRSGGRARLAAALASLRPTDGNTGLYDTALAAVRSQQASWQRRHVNAVLLLTDGRNVDDRGISLSQLLRTLREEQDPKRPVPVISIAYGADAGASAALAKISAVTGGATYQAQPREIEQVFLDALGQRACRPRCGPLPLH